MIYTTHYASPLGDILLVEASDGGLCGVYLEGQKYFFDPQKDEAEQRQTELLKQTALWLDRYFDGQKPRIDELKLAPKGSAFRLAVWQILCDIPYGEVTTYGKIAELMAARLGLARMSAQAVGGAVGHNPVSIIIPCHRVVGTNGSLNGYAGGIDKKVALLTHEGLDMSRFFLPKKVTAL